MKTLSLFLGTLLLGTATFSALAAPSNDDFENAALITESPVIASNVDATRQAGEPETVARPGFERSPLGGKSVWWRWVAPKTGLFTIKTGDRSGVQSSSEFDTQIGIYTGTSLDNLVEVASNEDSINFSGGLSSANIRAIQGTTYYILLDGYGGETGTYTLYVGESRFTLTVISNPSDAGTVVLNREFDELGYKAGTVVRVRAIPNPGQTFYGWTGATNSTNRTVSIVMNGNKTLVANYTFHHQLLLQRNTGQITAWQLLGTNYGNFKYLDGMPAGWKLLTTADLDLNGTPDLLFQHRDSRILGRLMDGNTRIRSTSLGRARPGFTLVGSGDFDNDSQPDLLFQRTNGALQVVLLKDLTRSVEINLSSVSEGWKAVTVSDINKDGSADILFQHTDGRIGVWLMDGTNQIADLELGRSDWKLVSVMDVNNDTVPDLIFQTMGRPGAWIMNQELQRVSSLVLANGNRIPVSWRLAATSK